MKVSFCEDCFRCLSNTEVQESMLSWRLRRNGIINSSLEALVRIRQLQGMLMCRAVALNACKGHKAPQKAGEEGDVVLGGGGGGGVE